MKNDLLNELKQFDLPSDIFDIVSKDEFETNIIIHWCEAVIAYYDSPEPIMSDTEFDDLMEVINGYCDKRVIDWINSVIYRNGKFETKHDDYVQEMISLFKIKYKSKTDLNEINKFFSQSGKNLNQLIRNGQLYIARKYDGCSLKLTYKDGELIQIITRGGIDVTEQFRYVPDIQNAKRFGTKIVCGELLIEKSKFIKKYSSEVGGDYENPRNFIGGLVKRKNIPGSVIRDLSFVPCTDGIDPLLNDCLVWSKCTAKDLNNLEELINLFRQQEFLCDGIVLAIKADNHERVVKDNYPLNMVALKFQAPRARTKVIGFDWTQKKSGKLTPRLIVEPVKLDGSTISYTNGYNISKVLDAGIGIGAEIEIEKSGDIIPIVVKVIKKSTNIEYPKIPYKRIGKHLIALDEEKTKRFKFIAGLRLLQIQGIGDTLAEQIGEELDFNILSVFDPAYKPCIVEKIGAGSVWTKFQEIYNIKTLHLDTLINLLQFDNVGPKIALKVANLILRISSDTSNISSDVLTNVCRGKGFVRIKQAINILKDYGIKVIKPVQISDETITFEMSGNPPSMTKDEFVKRMTEIRTGMIHTTLTKDTKYLIVDSLNSNTSKVIKARKYNIPLITYQDALNNKF